MRTNRPSSHQPPPAVDPMNRLRFPVDEWRLVETEVDLSDLGCTETLFATGNGYLGMRGNPEEGRESHSHGTFLNGLHETFEIRHAEDAFGFARTGQTIVHAPDSNLIKVYVDDEPILLGAADLEDYERSIDFREGILRRRLRWRTPAGYLLEMESTRMVSFDERHLAVMTMDIRLLEGNASVTVSSQIMNRQDGSDEYHVESAAMGEGWDPRKADNFDRRVLIPKRHWAEGQRLFLGYRCAHSGMTLAVGADHVFHTTGSVQRNAWAGEDSAKILYRTKLTESDTIRLEKYASYHSSRGVPTLELSDRVRRTLDRAMDRGVPGLHDDQRAWLADFWSDSDIVVHDQPELQQAVRWNLFQTAQASARAETVGIPAKGVSGSGYSGHYFWDTEVYLMPMLIYTRPQVARNAMRFRFQMLDAARQRAREMAQLGALFPWRTINGEEASAYYAAGTAQYHIDADVAYALTKYVMASGDVDYLLREGIDILVETARMWADLGFFRANGDEVFHIHGVTGPDEYTAVVNDNLFTNIMARDNLRKAADALAIIRDYWPDDYARIVDRLHIIDGELDEWRHCADAMEIPYDEELGIHPQDSHFLEREVWDLDATPADKLPLLLHFHPLVIYRFQVLKQADVVLALFLQGDQFSYEEKKRNFEYYDPITTGDSTLSGIVQAIIAAEVGYHDLALRYFYGALFVDLVDAHANTSDGVHVASAGAVWSALVSGFGGMRDHDGQLSFDPRLPESWTGLTFHFRVLGTKVRATLTQDSYTFEVIEGTALDLTVRGEKVMLSAGTSVTVDLDGQGPRLTGQPSQVAGKRDDGSTLIASLPRIDAGADPWEIG